MLLASLTKVVEAVSKTTEELAITARALAVESNRARKDIDRLVATVNELSDGDSVDETLTTNWKN